MEQPVKSNFFKKFKAIASLPILRPYFRFKKKKKRFLRKFSKPGHGKLVLCTYFNRSSWTFKVERYHFPLDIVFPNFLELHSTLSEKKIFVRNFPFLTASLKPQHPHPLEGQNPLRVTKVFIYALGLRLPKKNG